MSINYITRDINFITIKRTVQVAVLFVLIGFSFRGYAGSTDISIIRARIVTELLDSDVDSITVSNLISSIKDDGSWSDINYVDVSRIGYEHARHVSNIFYLAVAYNKPESSYYRNSGLLKVIKASIDYWTKNDFIADNWHTNEIGNPINLTRTLLLMDGALDKKQMVDLTLLAQRANLNAWGARPGGDLIKISGIMAEMAICRSDDVALKLALESIIGQVKIVSGLGIKADLGFHHRTDRVTSILAYGTGYAATFANWAVRLVGTSYSFPEEPLRLLIDYYLDGICKSLVHAKYKAPGIMNREISRKDALDATDDGMPQKLMRISTYRRQELENIAKIRIGDQSPNLTYNKFFFHSEYAIHQRPEYYTTVRMFSDRNHNMEAPHNEESLKMHHYADGANFISITGNEYYNIFPVWDWQKIPGATVVQKPGLPHWNEIVKKGKTKFVGAVSDSVYGAAAFDFVSPHDPLRARKAWFFFDKEYVCLGAGINSNAQLPVVTTLNQCLLNGEVLVKSNENKMTLSKGDHELKDISWILHDNIAYIFPKTCNVSLNNRTYLGNWQNIVNRNRSKSADAESKDLFSLWIDHGHQPKNASYEYTIAPTAGVTDFDPDKVTSNLVILSNTTHLQAVQNRELNNSQIVFYEPGEILLAEGVLLTASNPCMVLIKSSGKNIEQVTVADPTRSLNSIRLTITASFVGSTANWKAVWNKNKKTSDIHIDLPKGALAGKSLIIRNNTFDSEKKENRPISFDTIKKEKDKTKKAAKHYVGQLYGGGMVIWIDETGDHGLIAALEDLNKSIQWRNGSSIQSQHFGDHGDRVVNARGDGIGAGEMNTALIISQLTDDNISGDFAAKICANCKMNGYGDWYLPSKDELALMYQFKDKIGGFDNDMYWSSTEFNVGFSWGQNFQGYGGQYTQNKSSGYAVRCVRKF